MEFDLYFKPVSEKIAKFKELEGSKDRFVDIKMHTSTDKIGKLDNLDIVIFGVGEERISKNKGTANAPDEIRKKFYQLYKPSHSIRIADLGNLNLGETLKDTYAALKYVVIELRKKNIIPLIIGGSQDLTYAIFEAYRKITDSIDIVIVDSIIDLGNAKTNFSSESYISKIIQTKNNKVFNLSVLGYQNYLVNPRTIEKMRKMLLETYRLGVLKYDMAEIEPLLRDADIFSYDMRSIKQGDSPAHSTPSPNGFDAQEACQIAKYAGMSDNISTFALFEANPLFDKNNQTAHLSGQIIWHFISGFYERKKDFPNEENDDYKKFIVNIDSVNQDLIFFKSIKTNRWWIEISLSANSKKLVSCSYNDYLSAGKQEIPDIWWKTFQKLNR